MNIKCIENKTINHNEIQISYHPSNNREIHLLVRVMKKKLEEIEVFDDYHNYYGIPILFIYYFETIDQKVFVYTKDKIYRINKNIKYLKNKLKDYNFFQINSKTLVNKKHVLHYRIEKDSRRIVVLDNNETLVVNRYYKEELDQNTIKKSI